MRKIIHPLLLSLLLTPCLAFSAQKRIDEVVRQNLPLLQQLASEKSVIRDVLIRDANHLSAEQAQMIEKEWTSIGISNLEEPYLRNGTCDQIRCYGQKIPLMVKCFVLDRQGNVVGSVPQCKNFIHGNQDVFNKCFSQGKVYIQRPQLDKSTFIYSTHVSIPIFNHGRVIGVLVAVLSLE